MKKKKYVIQKVVIEANDEERYHRHLITKDVVPLLEINQYLEQKSLKSKNTGKQYAKKLVVYLNWLDQTDICSE